MPIKGDAKKVQASMKKQYGSEKGERIFYATANKQGRKPETWEKKSEARPRQIEPLGLDIQKLKGVGDAIAYAPKPPGPEDMPPPMKMAATEFFKQADRIPGGLADNKPDSDFPQNQLIQGQHVEMEHTNDPTVAREIAKDHLVESERYYIPHLRDMERRMKSEGGGQPGESYGKAAEFPATEYLKLAAGVPGGLQPGYSAATSRLKKEPPRPINTTANTLMRIPKSAVPTK